MYFWKNLHRYWSNSSILAIFGNFFINFYVIFTILPEKIDLAFPKWIKWHFFYFIFLKLKKLTVSHSSFNVTYMVIFWAKNVISTRNDPIEPHFRPKTGYLGTRESKSRMKLGGSFLRLFKYGKYSVNLTFLVIFREKIVRSAKIYL